MHTDLNQSTGKPSPLFENFKLNATGEKICNTQLPTAISISKMSVLKLTITHDQTAALGYLQNAK